MEQVWAVILAAGEGKRMRSSLPKVLHPLCGRPMLRYVLDCAASLAERIVVVVGHGGDRVREALGPDVLIVTQAEQKGTGHALLQALPVLPAQGKLLVLCGDTPLIEPHHLHGLVDSQGTGAAAVLTALLPNPAGYGRVVRRAGGTLEAIVEDRDASAHEKEITEINTGTYCFDLSVLRRLLTRVKNENAQGEYYLPDVLPLMMQEGLPVALHSVEDYRVALGVNDRSQLADAAAAWRRRINRAHMLAGVTLLDPDSTSIDYDVFIGEETLIYPYTIIEGESTVGRRCRLGPHAHLVRSRLGDNVSVRFSVVEDSILDHEARVGPFACVRPGAG